MPPIRLWHHRLEPGAKSELCIIHVTSKKKPNAPQTRDASRDESNALALQLVRTFA